MVLKFQNQTYHIPTSSAIAFKKSNFFTIPGLLSHAEGTTQPQMNDDSTVEMTIIDIFTINSIAKFKIKEKELLKNGI